MLTAVIVVVAAVGAWVLVDWLLSRRDERLQRGRAEWLAAGPNRTFHSTAWEDTVPPLEVNDDDLTPALKRERRQSAV
jgi:hypothetical protein